MPPLRVIYSLGFIPVGIVPLLIGLVEGKTKPAARLDKSVGLRHGYGRRDSYGNISGVFSSSSNFQQKKPGPCHVTSLVEPLRPKSWPAWGEAATDSWLVHSQLWACLKIGQPKLYHDWGVYIVTDKYLEHRLEKKITNRHSGDVLSMGSEKTS